MRVASSRVVGVDVARGLAILGMFVAHAIPRGGEEEILADGRSSILFATLAGVSLGLITGGADPAPRGARADRVTSIAVRALILFVLGVALSTIGSEIAIILDYYAIMFALLLPVLFLPRAALAVIAAVLAVMAPLVASAVGDEPPAVPDLGYFAQYYLLTGYYPALVWLPFLLVGLICARSGLTRGVVQVRMLAGGTIAAVLGYGGAAVLPGVTAEAHSSTTAEVVASGGLAIAVLGLLLLITSPRTGRVGAGIRTALLPVAATGSMSLTVYTLQIVALAVAARVRDSSGDIDYPGWPLLAGLCVASLLFATLWRTFLGSGPLERAMTLLTRSDRAASRAGG